MVEGSILTGFWAAGITRRLEVHDLAWQRALVQCNGNGFTF
jgi:hypothetical protein